MFTSMPKTSNGELLKTNLISYLEIINKRFSFRFWFGVEYLANFHGIWKQC